MVKVTWFRSCENYTTILEFTNENMFHIIEISDGTRTSSDILRELAVALLQIERGIDRKYLKGPLGKFYVFFILTLV